MVFTSKLFKLIDGFQFTEGPTWHRDGFLLFSDIPANRIFKINEDNGCEVWRVDSGNSNGLAFDRQGRLIACEHGNRRVSRTETDGTISVIADRYQGKRLNSPNDCVCRSDGMIFFSDPPYGLEGRPQELPFHAVFAVKPGNEPIPIVTHFEKPNGLAFSPDEQILYIADTQRERVMAFDVENDGTVKNERIFMQVGRPDGMKTDRDGNLYIASTEGIVVVSPAGQRIETLSIPERPSNCAFGSEEAQTLYITARARVYKIQTKNPGCFFQTRN
jgi:gluconolactonase